MAHVSRLSTILSRYSPRFCVAGISTSATDAASLSQDTLDSPDIQKTSFPHNKSPVIVFDAPSRPSEHHRRRSARKVDSLSEYYSIRRRLASRPLQQVRSSISTSTTNLSPLNSVPYPENVHTRIFDSPSKPREYYTRPQRKRDLPELKSSLPLIVVLTVLGLSAWGAFILYATNTERLSSSVVRQLSSNLRTMDIVKETLGDRVELEGKWWLGGEPYINGAINLLQGNVDVSFRIRGSKGAGTVYFTSVREEKGRPFTILRSKIICDNGVVLRLNQT